jgi:hypothetical protein
MRDRLCIVMAALMTTGRALRRCDYRRLQRSGIGEQFRQVQSSRHVAVSQDGRAVSSRTTSILSATIKAAKLAAPPKLWMSLNDCRVPGVCRNKRAILFYVSTPNSPLVLP